MNIDWSILVAATGSAAIDFLEIAVIAYAIARTGYLQEALWGSLSGVLLVAAIAVPLSQVLERLPLSGLEILVGATLFGLGGRWVSKSIRRQVSGQRAGWMSADPLAAEGIVLDGLAEPNSRFSLLNFWVMTKSSMLETLEVAILIVTLGSASSRWYEAFAGTAIALIFAIVVVLLLHNYLLKIPEGLIRLGAGILLSGLGTFWLGEGLGFEWWFKDFAIVAIVSLYGGLAMLAIAGLKRQEANVITDQPE